MSLYKRKVPCAFHFVGIFHFIEMQSVIFIAHCNFLTKFFSSHPSFNKNFFDITLLKFYACATTQLLVYTYYILISRHGVSWKVTLRILLINGVNRQVVSVITWLFLEILSDVHHLTRNTNLSTSYKVNIWVK